jgi:hypothetical protein
LGEKRREATKTGIARRTWNIWICKNVGNTCHSF